MTKIDPIELLRIIDDGERRVHTNSLDISLNELADMVSEGELVLDPDFQRIFQWQEETRSRFIESLLLELPVPPIFGVEEESGKYILIDGLQRLSSYLHFRGQLDAPQFDPPVRLGDFLVLDGCDIVTQLNGITYNDLPTNLQIRVKRSFMRFEIIKQTSDSTIKYNMFKRLNSGGIPLSDQQKRNASIRMLDGKFISFIDRLSKNEDFSSTIYPISEEKNNSWYNVELVLRFFAMKNWRSRFKHDVREFLNDYAESVAISDSKDESSFDYVLEEEIFNTTFLILNEAFGEKAFSFKTKKNNDISGFSVLQFEAITLGLQEHIEFLNILSPEVRTELVKSVLKRLKFDPKYITLTTGGGKNSSGPFKERIEYFSKAIGSAIDELTPR